GRGAASSGSFGGGACASSSAVRVTPMSSPGGRARVVAQPAPSRAQAISGRLRANMSKSLSSQRLWEQSAGLAGGEDPDLVGRAGGADVQQMSRLIVDRVGGLADVDQHDIVELEPFDLSHVGDVDAWAKWEVLLGD